MANIQNSSTDYSAASSRRLATAGNDVVVGFDDDLLVIKEKLCGETRSLQIIPIVGMGGIGKTTLARNAFHDPLIKESFHIGGWVTVSQSYNLQQILTTLKESLKESFDGKQPEEEEAQIERIPLVCEKRSKHLLQKSQKVHFQKPQQLIVFEETDKYTTILHEECTEPATTAKEHDETNVLESLKESFDGKQPEEEEAQIERIQLVCAKKEKLSKQASVRNAKAILQNPYTESFTLSVQDLLFEGSPESTSDQVYKTLKGRKYLIVMDDIWSTEVCDHLKRIFPDDDNGSRVILTTRLQDVATYAKDCRPHEMRLMQEDQSWDLLRQKVATCTHELEDIGKAIAKSCGGLPLAIVVIAGLLSSVDRTRASWEEIKDKVNSTVSAKDGQLEKILSFSYMDLPPHLRQCFVYMGGFPEDSEIPVTKLVKLWIAEGFIGGTTASKSLEGKAEECLKDLIKRSLVLVGTKKPHGEIKSCSLHDMVRDLCVRKAQEEKFPLHKSIDGTLVERLKVGCSEDVRYLRVMEVGKYVLNPFPEGPELHAWIPEQIFRLSNLRYLVLAYFVEIPAAVSYLENLQTFIIYAMEGLVRLPPEIWTMPQLRHLVSSFEPLPCPKGESTCNSLENLQTLSEVSNLECTNTLVEMIPNIKKLRLLYSGSYEFEQDYQLDDLLCLNQLENLFNSTRDHDYHLENLERLQQLEKLKVRVYPGFQGILNPVFPQSLKKLSLSGWRLTSWKDMTIASSLPNLQVLKLRGLRGQGEKWETIEGEFPRLTFLLIERSDLREWITEPEHFPNLKQLLLHYCYCLDEIPSKVGDIPTLELIEVEEGSTSLVASARRIEEEQKEMGNESLQVRCTEI